MWRGRTIERDVREAGSRARWEPPVAAVIIVGVVVGALLSGWWSIDRSRDRSDQAVNLTSVAPVSWPVTPERPWEAAVVRVATTQCLADGGRNEIAGTGVIVDGAVVTNHHVVGSARSVLVTTHDGVEHRVESMGTSDRIDLAELRVEGLDSGLRFASSDPADASIHLAGFPAGDRYVAREVEIVGTVEGWGYPDPASALHLDAAVIPGESGSPLIDADGRVTALLYARALSDGNGLAIDGAEVASELARLDPRPFADC